MKQSARLGTKKDELTYSGEGLSLCLLISRRSRVARVIDFRSGPHPAKRKVVLDLARKEGAERVFTLVERDEVNTWVRSGFTREGNIPGFYKRSDAWILGTSVTPEDPEQSGLRPVPAEAVEAGAAEAAYQAARKHMKELEAAGGVPRVPVKLALLAEDAAAKAVSVAASAGRALTRFEPFGRDVVRTHHLATARGGFALPLSIERQECFDNALVEVLTPPRTEKEAHALHATLGAVGQHLLAQKVVSCFALSPVDEPAMAVAFLMSGFRRTATLGQHLLVGKRRVDAFLWSRKLAAVTDE